MRGCRSRDSTTSPGPRASIARDRPVRGRDRIRMCPGWPRPARVAVPPPRPPGAQAGQRRDESFGVCHVLDDHAEGQDVERLRALQVLEGTLVRLGRERVAADVVARIDDREAGAAAGQGGRQPRVVREWAAAAPDVQPARPAADQAIQDRLIPVRGIEIAVSGRSGGRPIRPLSGHRAWCGRPRRAPRAMAGRGASLRQPARRYRSSEGPLSRTHLPGA